MSLTRRRAAIALAASAAALAVAPASAAPSAPGDMTIGNPKAPVHVVEYLSLTCPHCAHFNAESFPALKAKYIDTGQIRYTVRELLTAPAQVAAGFVMARCNDATPERYFKVVDEVLRSQPRWAAGNIKPIFVEIAAKNGMTEAQFEACLRDEKAQADLQARIDYAVNIDKVQGTPTFFVNGVKVENVESLAELEPAIAKAKSGRR